MNVQFLMTGVVSESMMNQIRTMLEDSNATFTVRVHQPFGDWLASLPDQMVEGFMSAIGDQVKASSKDTVGIEYALAQVTSYTPRKWAEEAYRELCGQGVREEMIMRLVNDAFDSVATQRQRVEQAAAELIQLSATHPNVDVITVAKHALDGITISGRGKWQELKERVEELIEKYGKYVVSRSLFRVMGN